MPLRLYSSVLIALCRAWLANRLGRNKWIPLPPVAPAVTTALPAEQLAAQVDSIVCRAIVNTAHLCLYQGYARCCVLRKFGYPAKLNMGLHNLDEKNRTEGHCWVSLDGKALCEEKEPRETYPDMMGERNGVVYWARLHKDDGKRFVRLRKE